MIYMMCENKTNIHVSTTHTYINQIYHPKQNVTPPPSSIFTTQDPHNGPKLPGLHMIASLSHRLEEKLDKSKQSVNDDSLNFRDEDDDDEEDDDEADIFKQVSLAHLYTF
jgi:hypothetical protein